MDLLLLLHPRLWQREPARLGKPQYAKFNDIPKSFLHPDMIRNYLKIAVRNLVKNKSYSAINIGGLAVGMAVAMLIGIWINDEVSANKHHKNYETIYEVKMHQNLRWSSRNTGCVTVPIGEELKANYPDFKAVVMYDRGDGHRSLVVGAQKFLKHGLYIGEDAIDMFSLTILNGDKNPLKEPYSIVLTDETAHALFGNQDPIGKTLKLDNTTDVKVTAVVARQPTNATLQFDYLLPWQLQEKIYDWVVKYHKTNWENNSWGLSYSLKRASTPRKPSRK